jgi:hypothetical protein
MNSNSVDQFLKAPHYPLDGQKPDEVIVASLVLGLLTYELVLGKDLEKLKTLLMRRVKEVIRKFIYFPGYFTELALDLSEVDQNVIATVDWLIIQKELFYSVEYREYSLDTGDSSRSSIYSRLLNFYRAVYQDLIKGIILGSSVADERLKEIRDQYYLKS